MKKNIYSIALITLIIDQVIKYLITTNMELFTSITIIPNFFSISYIHNTGAAWGILNNKVFLLIIITTAFLIAFNKWIGKLNKVKCLTVISYGLLLGGVLGNFIDRIINKYVIDYLSFIFGNYAFPIFNFADICIVCSAIIIVIDLIRSELHEHKCH